MRMSFTKHLLLALIAFVVSSTRAADQPRSFSWSDDKALGVDSKVHGIEATFTPVSGRAYAYASFATGPANPLPYVDGQPQGVQILVLGHQEKNQFHPVVKIGLADSGGGPKGHALLVSWAHDGRLEYFGSYARPATWCDFKLVLDLNAGRCDVWCVVRGDDDWFLLAENVPLIEKTGVVDAARVEQCPGSAGIGNVVISGKPWAEGEAIRPHPAAKKDRVVGDGQGFKFQSMRSMWRKPGRQVTIARNPPEWMGFPQVACVGQRTLVVAHNNGTQHGGGGGLFIRRSEDLGRIWGEAIRVHPSGVNSPRLQVLKDGSLLLLTDINDSVGLTLLYRSEDGGKTWTKIGELNAERAGGHASQVPSQVHETPDGAWLIVGSWYPGGAPYGGTQGEQLEFFRSTDRGATWRFHAALQAFPTYRHSLSEASILPLPDGRLVLFAREDRWDGFPGVKAFSRDGGKTWDVHELPFAIIGRTHAGFLPDGRVMLTFRSGIGRQALWAWVGDPLEDVPMKAQGVHFNDARSVALKDDELHLDNDGQCGQFTQYFLRPPSDPGCTLDVTAELKVIDNAGLAATLSLPYAGKLRVFPDHVVWMPQPDAVIRVEPGAFHTYRALVRGGKLTLFVDGQEKLATTQLDGDHFCMEPWTPARTSKYGLAFGNERVRKWSNSDPHAKMVEVNPNIWGPNIAPQVTGYSIWRRFQATVGEASGKARATDWIAGRDGFPDQYQLDHIVQVEASVTGRDQGYSGWTLLPDGRIFVVGYTDDTAPLVPSRDPNAEPRWGISWIRGTFLQPEDLPR